MNQSDGHRLAERELDGAFRAFIRGLRGRFANCRAHLAQQGLNVRRETARILFEIGRTCGGHGERNRRRLGGRLRRIVARFNGARLQPFAMARTLKGMTDQEIAPFLDKPVRVTLADRRIFAGVLRIADDGHGHGHGHYLVVSDPVREGERPVVEVIHGGDQIAMIEDASDDPAATK